jgi:phytoene dehydrogenase-like protein
MEMFVRLSTYTHAPELFDAGAAVAQLQLATKGVRYLDGGWAQLIKVLGREAEHAGATIIGHTEVHNVRSSQGRVEVVIGEHVVTAAAAVIASGGPDLATRLTDEPVADRDALTGPIAANCLDLALRRPHDGFVLGMDQPLYLSAHAPLAALAPAGGGLVSLMRYLAPGESAGEPGTARAILRDLARLDGIGDDDVLFERALHRMVVTHGAPTAVGGGLPGRPSISALGQPGIFVAGDWVGPSGLLADASSASGAEAGREASRLSARMQA